MSPPVLTPPKTPWQSRVGYYMIGIAVGLAILGAVNAIKKIQAARSLNTDAQPMPGKVK